MCPHATLTHRCQDSRQHNCDTMVDATRPLRSHTACSCIRIQLGKLPQQTWAVCAIGGLATTCSRRLLTQPAAVDVVHQQGAIVPWPQALQKCWWKLLLLLLLCGVGTGCVGGCSGCSGCSACEGCWQGPTKGVLVGHIGQQEHLLLAESVPRPPVKSREQGNVESMCVQTVIVSCCSSGMITLLASASTDAVSVLVLSKCIVPRTCRA